MEKFWFCVLYLGLVVGSLVAQQFDVSLLEQRIAGLNNMPDLVRALEESAISLERIPDMGRSLERISNLERFLKDKTESLSCKEAQKNLDKVQQMVETLQLNFESLQQTVENL